MSIKSTKCVTRKELIEYICEALYIPDMWDCFTNEQLEDMAEEIDRRKGNIFNNYLIVGEEGKSRKEEQ